MTYTEEQIEELTEEHTKILDALRELQTQCVLQGHSLENPIAKEFLLHGAGRRIQVIRRCFESIFEIFPPSSKKPLSSEFLSDVQINLQAFVINIFGVFDNWAWAFVHRHNLPFDGKRRNQVGMFNPGLKSFLPPQIREYISSKAIARWQREYLKDYRDALAHRIPLYIPPANYTHEENERFNLLEVEKIRCLKSKSWERYEAICCEQDSIGEASLMFLHAFKESGGSKPLYLHYQIICDCKTVLEFGKIFSEHWHESTKI